MSTWVALMRGVNIGRRRLAMADLRRALEAAGGTEVATYLQSGNAVLDVPPTAGTTAATVGNWLEDVIGAVAGFEVPVTVRTGHQLAALVAANPYPGAAGKTLHVVFYQPGPEAGPVADQVVGRIDPTAFAPEECTPRGDDLFLHLPDGIGNSALAKAVDAAARRKPALMGTARNWNTVTELAALASR